MAIVGVKPCCKAAWSLFLVVIATIAVWKEITLGRKMCQGISLSRRKSFNVLPAPGDAMLARRPVREEPLNSAGGNASRNYMRRNDQFQRDYPRIESPNITLFATSPPSSGVVNLIELFYALPLAHERTIVPLVDNNILSSGNSGGIRDYIRNAIHSAQSPALVHTHAYHVDLSDHTNNNSTNPWETMLQISVVRHPIERAVSLYNYARANNTHRDSELVRKWRDSLKIRRQESYDDCVRLRRSECVSETSAIRLVHHFCGYDRRCQKKTRWALDRAKQNIDSNYYLIGTRDDFQIFIQVLERKLPLLFGGGSILYYDLLDRGKVTRRDRFTLTMPSNGTVERMKSIMALDIELYEWIRERFQNAQISVGLRI